MIVNGMLAAADDDGDIAAYERVCVCVYSLYIGTYTHTNMHVNV